MVGGALALDRALPFDARIAYRRAFSQTVAPAPGYPEAGVNHESVSMTAGTHFRDRLFVTVGVRYNLLVAAWDDQQAALRCRFGRRHQLSVDYSYLAPTFDGDSIWNVFGAGPYADLRAGYDLELSSVWNAHVRGFRRAFVDFPGTSSTPYGCLFGSAGTPCARAYGGNAGADGRTQVARVRLDVYAEGGTGGWKLGGDLSGRVAVRPHVLDIEGRWTTYAWRQEGLPQPRDVLMVGIALGARYQMSRNMRLHFLGEDNTGTYYRAQIRGLAILEVDVAL
jgi:hypothetical protein